MNTSDTAGFDWIGGDVTRIAPDDPALKVPHMGWNDLVIDRAHPVLEGVQTGDHAYFVHSYQMRVADPAERLAHVDYGGDVTAVVGAGQHDRHAVPPREEPAAGAADDRQFPALAALRR